MTSLSTLFMRIVLLISKKFCNCALASSCAFPLNCVACTKLMRLGLSSNSGTPSSTASHGPVGMFSRLGAENSCRVFCAIASAIGS